MRDIDRAVNAIAALDLNGANKRLAAYWLSRWQGDKPPSRERFDMKQVWEFSPALMILAIRKDEIMRCVSAGAFTKLALGYDLVGEDVLSLTSAAEREERLAFCWQIVLGAVTVFYRAYESAGHAKGLAQGTSLPFCDVDADGTRYFAMHSNWRPVGNEWTLGNVSADVQMPPRRMIVSFKQRPVEAAA